MQVGLTASELTLFFFFNPAGMMASQEILPFNEKHIFNKGICLYSSNEISI